MQQPKPLSITISKPCTQNWNDMQADGKGKFCSSCQSTVVDFTYLSDTELYDYFKNLKTIPCGRFHNSQLNRPVTPVIVKRKNPWMAIYKPLAAALAFFMMKYNATAGNKKEYKTIISPRQSASHSIIVPGSVTITGTVLHEEGQPIGNARIFIENKLAATTNAQGKYSFDFQIDGTPRSYNITIAAEGMVTIVRTYHPSMLSTTFDVTMAVFEDDCCVTMGAPRIHKITDVRVHFERKKAGAGNFPDSVNTQLAALAVEMRNHPEVVINIDAHSGVEPLDRARQEKLRNYLVEKEGISEGRIRFRTIVINDPEARDLIIIGAVLE
jgi:hypothetical protein